MPSDDPTIPPPHRKRLPAPQVIEVSRLPIDRPKPLAGREDSDKPITDERSELFLQKLQEVADIYDRKIAELESDHEQLKIQLENAHSTIRRLTSAQTQFVHDDAVMSETLAAHLRTMRVEVERAVDERFKSQAAAAGAEAAVGVSTSMGKSISKTAKGWSAIIAIVTSGVIAGVASYAQQSCQSPPTDLSVGQTAPLPQPNPQNPAGIPGPSR